MARCQNAPLTRREVAVRLGVSLSKVRRMEGTMLHPQVDAAGVHRFDAADVARLARAAGYTAARSPDGETAARVFEMFRQNRELSDIVVALRVSPHVVRDLYDEYCTDLISGSADRADARWRRDEQRDRARVHRTYGL